MVIVQLGELSDAHMGKVLRPQTQEFPCSRVHGRKGKLMCQIVILPFQPGIIIIVDGFIAVFLRNGIEVQQSGLAHEYGFYLEQVVSVVCHGLQRDMLCPRFESIPIDAETEITGQGDEVSPFPIALQFFHTGCYSLRTLFQPFVKQGVHPTVHCERVDLRNDAVASRIIRCPAQFLVVLAQVARNFQFHLWKCLSVLCDDGAVGCFRHMQDDVVIMYVFVMTVDVPVGGSSVNLDVAHPCRSVQFDFGVEKVRAGISVECSRVDDLYRLAVCGLQRFEWKEFVFPDVVQQLFHGARAEKFIFTNKSNEIQVKSLSLREKISAYYLKNMKIALIGYGKMGHMIEQIALERGHEIVSIIDIDNREDFASEAFRSADVAIEFTTPQTAYDNYLQAFAAGVKVVSGSTGWIPEHGEEVRRLCREEGHTLFWSSNFSLGVAIFGAVNRYLAHIMSGFPAYDVRMEEVHHVHKLDAPSGTAITLAEDLIHAIGRKDKWVKGTFTAPDGTVSGTEACAANELRVDSIRRGEVPGIHSVVYDSEADCITITHDAHNRKGFALGAVLAAEYTATHEGLLTMDDLFQF